MKRIVVFILWICVCNSATAGELLLQGTIGKYPVVMQVDIDKNQAMGDYFYTSTCRDIHLNGLAKGSFISLFSSRYNGKKGREDTTESIQLNRNSNGTWAGKWSNLKGKTLEVQLRPLDVNTLKHPFANVAIVAANKKNNAYEYARSSFVRIIPDSPLVKNGRYTLQYFHFQNKDFKLFKITGGLDATVAEKVNATIMDLFLQHAGNYCSCGATSGEPDYSLNVSGVLLTDNVLSIYISTGGYCEGNAHPFEDETGLNIDLKTGKKLILQDVLYLAPDPKPGSDVDSYRSGVYGPKLFAFLQKRFPKQMADNEAAECNYGTADIWSYADWYIANDGLHLLPSFPHAAAPCRAPEWCVIPFDVLKQYSHPARKITLP